MRKHNVIQYIIIVLFICLFASIQVINAQENKLTPEEIQQYQDELGITLSETEQNKIAEIVKPAEPLPQWRIDAESRIEQHRKAGLVVELVDKEGLPISGATVNIKLRKSAFKFGGVVNAQDLTDASSKLSDAGTTTDDWKRLVTGLCNAIGTGNNFKPKLVNGHQYLPNFLNWAEGEKLDVRGHVLMWPGGGHLEDLDDSDAVSGDDYGKHLSRGWPSPLKEIEGYEDVVSYNVLGAVDTYKESGRTQADRDVLKAVIDAEIKQWASLWNVYEWDVINETNGNTFLMEILGYEQMAEWFKITAANVANQECKLLINEYQIISATEDPDPPSWASYETKKTTYMTRIDKVIADGGRIDRIGFQNRYKFGVPNPATAYARLEEFSTKYERALVGTEFEIVDSPESNYSPYDFTEDERATITEEILTAYYSHPRTTGLFNWTFMHENDEKALTYYDGTVKLNGLVWYYLHRIRYTTNEQIVSNNEGNCSLRAFKGEYDFTADYEGKTYQMSMILDSDSTVQFKLDDVTTEVQQSLLPDLNVYPNPVNDVLFLEAAAPIHNIEIIDLYGKTILTKTNATQVHMNSFSRGFYCLRCLVGDDLIIKRIVKN